jgi:protein gp37
MTTTNRRKEVRAAFNGEIAAYPLGHREWIWPLKYKGAADPRLGPGMPSLILVSSMADLFYEPRPGEIIDLVCSTLALSDHIGLLPTRRAQRMMEYFLGKDPATVRRWQPKLWCGFSAANQELFDAYWPFMRSLADAGWFVFVSISPMLGPVRLPEDFLAFGNRVWAICSGEQREPGFTGRYADPDWFRAIRDQCKEAGVSYFTKQMADRQPIPLDLFIREFPLVDRCGVPLIGRRNCD